MNTNKYIDLIKELEGIEKAYPAFKTIKCDSKPIVKGQDIRLFMVSPSGQPFWVGLKNTEIPNLYEYFQDKKDDEKQIAGLKIKFKNRLKKLKKKSAVNTDDKLETIVGRIESLRFDYPEVLVVSGNHRLFSIIDDNHHKVTCYELTSEKYAKTVYVGTTGEARGPFFKPLSESVVKEIENDVIYAVTGVDIDERQILLAQLNMIHDKFPDVFKQENNCIYRVVSKSNWLVVWDIRQTTAMRTQFVGSEDSYALVGAIEIPLGKVLKEIQSDISDAQKVSEVQEVKPTYSTEKYKNDVEQHIRKISDYVKSIENELKSIRLLSNIHEGE